MLDFDIQRCTRRCAALDRELAPGETFYSVLTQRGADVVRIDYSEEGWGGAPEGALGWWKSQMPDATGAGKASLAPSDVILQYFEQLESDPDRQDLRYVLALLMIRRRIVRLENTETDEQGRETLVLHCPRNETEYRTPVAPPDDARAAEIQTELSRLLFSDA
ncbi:MAG: hypothetical protein KY475_27245 [Planctomycetes bacterium]|nr:hypothetical protein [Planctomycetota bacterium]